MILQSHPSPRTDPDGDAQVPITKRAIYLQTDIDGSASFEEVEGYTDSTGKFIRRRSREYKIPQIPQQLLTALVNLFKQAKGE